MVSFLCTVLNKIGLRAIFNYILHSTQNVFGTDVSTYILYFSGIFKDNLIYYPTELKDHIKTYISHFGSGKGIKIPTSQMYIII